MYFSSMTFSMPKRIEIPVRTLKFYHTIVKTLGSIKYIHKYRDLIPKAVTPKEYIHLVHKNERHLRILQAGVKEENKKTKKVTKNPLDKRVKKVPKKAKVDPTQVASHKKLKGKTIPEWLKKTWHIAFKREEGDAQVDFSTDAKTAAARDLQAAQTSTQNNPSSPKLDINLYAKGGFEKFQISANLIKVPLIALLLLFAFIN